MKKFLLILPLFMSVCLLCGCAHDDDASPSGVSPDAPQVSFVLSLTDATPKTRATTWGDAYESENGYGYENRIDPDDVQVLLYTTGGNYVANVDILSYYPLNNDSEGCEYRFVGSVTADEGELTAGKYKLMVFANCGEVTPNQSDPTDQSHLSQLSYDYKAANVKDGSQLIPMWGVITPNITLEKGKQQDLGQIDLLRAMAKVEIKLDKAISGTYTITSATLTKYNTSGYCLPAGYASVNETTELEQETGTNPAIDTFHPYQTTDNTGTDLPFVISKEDGKTAWLYIPEYDNLTNSTDAATISLTVSDGTTTNTVTGTLEFKDYENGTATGDAHNIVRNHIYRYTVNVKTGKLIVQYKALPWNLVTSSIGWKPQPASTTSNPFETDKSYQTFVDGANYILLPYKSRSRSNYSSLYKDASNGDVEAVYCFVCRPNYKDKESQKVLNKGTGGVRYCFMLTGPKGATWEAHLTNNEDFRFSYSVADGVKMASHGIARDDAYIIQINAIHNYTGTAVGQTGYEAEDTPDYDVEKPGEKYFGNDYLTDWGKEKWFSQQVVDTEFYITVRLTDGTEYELTINPEYDGVVKNTCFGKRRYAGTDTRIWIRQLRAQYGWEYTDLVKNVEPTTSAGTGENDYAWWRVNPYWE